MESLVTYHTHYLNVLGSGIGLDSGKEHIINIRLKLEWNGHTLRDSFTWDLSNPDNVPEEFAAILVNDL